MGVPGPKTNLVIMEIHDQIHDYGLNTYACDSALAGPGTLPADEEMDRSHRAEAGRPGYCGGEKSKNSIRRPHKRHENMIGNEESRGSGPLGLSGLTILLIASYILKPFGIGINRKVLSQLEVA